MNSAARERWAKLGWQYHITVASYEGHLDPEHSQLWDELSQEWNGTTYWFQVNSVNDHAIAHLSPWTCLLMDSRMVLLHGNSCYGSRPFHVSM